MNRRTNQADALAPHELAPADVEYLPELRQILEREMVAILADAPLFGSIGFTVVFHAGRAARLDRSRSVQAKAGAE
jgi:hypothetical protein